MFATPIAYVIDEHRNITEDVAVGTSAILALVASSGKSRNLETGETMREQMQARLATLRQESEKGQIELQKLERQQVSLRETMLRISGAIQVLEEVLAQEAPERQNGVPGSDESIGALQATTPLG